VHIREAAGPTITLPAEQLLTSGIRLTGAADVQAEAVPQASKQIRDWMKGRKLTMDISKCRSTSKSMGAKDGSLKG
jgi:prephenate dehydratase